VGDELVRLGLILLVNWACLDCQGEVSSFGWTLEKEEKNTRSILTTQLLWASDPPPPTSSTTYKTSFFLCEDRKTRYGPHSNFETMLIV